MLPPPIEVAYHLYVVIDFPASPLANFPALIIIAAIVRKL
jgi:hypothetical protein